MMHQRAKKRAYGEYLSAEPVSCNSLMIAPLPSRLGSLGGPETGNGDADRVYGVQNTVRINGSASRRLAPKDCDSGSKYGLSHDPAPAC